MDSSNPSVFKKNFQTFSKADWLQFVQCFVHGMLCSLRCFATKRIIVIFQQSVFLFPPFAMIIKWHRLVSPTISPKIWEGIKETISFWSSNKAGSIIQYSSRQWVIAPCRNHGRKCSSTSFYGHLRSATKYDLMCVKKPDRFLVEWKGTRSYSVDGRCCQPQACFAEVLGWWGIGGWVLPVIKHGYVGGK